MHNFALPFFNFDAEAEATVLGLEGARRHIEFVISTISSPSEVLSFGVRPCSVIPSFPGQT